MSLDIENLRNITKDSGGRAAAGLDSLSVSERNRGVGEARYFDDDY